MTTCFHLFAGIGAAWISDRNIPLDVRCKYSLTVSVGDAGVASGSGLLRLDSIVLAPALTETGVFIGAGLCVDFR